MALGDATPRASVHRRTALKGPDLFRLGVAVIGLTAYIGVPGALFAWLVSGGVQLVAERLAAAP